MVVRFFILFSVEMVPGRPVGGVGLLMCYVGFCICSAALEKDQSLCHSVFYSFLFVFIRFIT